MKMIESQGRTLEEAIENGLNQLGLAREDTDITVLDEATKGFLGFGARPARVLLTEKLRRVSQAAEEERIARENMENRERQRERENELRRRREEEREARERKRAQRAEKVERAENAADGRTAVIEKAERPAKVAVADDAATKEKNEAVKDSNRNDRAVKSGQKRPAQAKEPRQAGAKEARAARPSRERAFLQGRETDLSKEAKDYLENLLKLMDVSIEVAAVETENGLYINASGPDAGTLIGYRGETLDALQYLVSLKVNKGEDDYQRVSLDAEDYRAKREEILIKLAQRLATKAVKTGRKVALEPMNPYERRILHSALQGHTGVRTHSEGSDPYRRVVITPKTAQRRSQAGVRQGRQKAEEQPAAESPATE